MKQFKMQTLAAVLVITLTACASSKPIPLNEQRSRIRQEANLLLNTLDLPLRTQRVARVSSMGTTVCTKDVFCKAEMILDGNSKLHNHTLTRLLSEYNKASNETNCSIDQDYQYHIEDLLTDIRNCSMF